MATNNGTTSMARGFSPRAPSLGRMQDTEANRQAVDGVLARTPQGTSVVLPNVPPPMSTLMPAHPETAAGMRDHLMGQRPETALGFKNGGDLGMVGSGTVPGTGKGDKIKAAYEPGEFVVSNAMLEANPGLREQLHAARAQVLATQGRTPEQADAKNSAAMAKVDTAKGFKPDLFFDTGGVAGDEEQKRLARQSAMYVVGAQANAASRPEPVTAQTIAPENPVTPPDQPSDYGRQMGEIGGFFADGAKAAVKTIVSAPGYGFNQGSTPAADPGAAVTSAGPLQQPQAISQPTAATAAAPTPAATAPQAAQPSTGNPNQNNVTRQPNGTMSFSGGPNIGKDGGEISYNTGASGFKPGGGAISAQNMAAAENLSARSAARDRIAPTNDLIGGMTPQRRSEYLQEIALSPVGTPGRKAAIDMSRDQTTANTSSKVQDSANKLAQQKFGLDTQEFGLKRTAAGFASRAAQQLETAQSAYANAKTDTEREAAREVLRSLQGKYEKDMPNRYTVVPGGQSIDMDTKQLVRDPAQVLDNQTGEFRTPAQAKPTLPPGMTRQVGTQNGKPVYEDKSGKRFVGA